MNRRKLGANGFHVSEVGLGCWQLGSSWGEELDQQRAFEILQTAVEQGITFLDTADVYGNGRSEQLIGAFLKQSKADIKVATKFGRAGGVYPNQYTEQTLRTGIEASLQRLKVDSIDLLQLHCIPKAVLIKGEIFDWLRKLQAEGKIKHFGASVESVEEGLICLEQKGLLSLQVIYNIFRQKLTGELLPHAKAKGVGIIVRLPLASGLLAGKFTQTTTFHESDHRNFNRDGAHFNVGETFAGIPFEKGVKLADELKTMVPNGMSLVDFSLRWLLDQEAVSTIIPGARNPQQVIGNAKTSTITSLPAELMERLEHFYQEKVQHHIRGAY